MFGLFKKKRKVAEKKAEPAEKTVATQAEPAKKAEPAEKKTVAIQAEPAKNAEAAEKKTVVAQAEPAKKAEPAEKKTVATQAEPAKKAEPAEKKAVVAQAEPAKKDEPAKKAAPAPKAAESKAEVKPAVDEITEAAITGKGMFEVKRASDGRYMFNVRAGNTQIIASSQMYTAMASCRNGIKSVGVNAPIAPIEDQTLATVNKEKCPKFQIYFDKGGKYRFNLLAANGDNILSCTQGYTRKSSCQNGIKSVINNANAAVVLLGEDD